MKSNYDKKYQNPNFFNYSQWMFAPYVDALVKKYQVQKNSYILDVGCGTGFFSQLFQNQGMAVVGIDMSTIGVRTARKLRSTGLHLVIGDGNKLPFRLQSFDLIFCRGYAPYNLKEFGTQTEITRYLFRFLRDHGIFIYASSTDLSGVANPRRRLVGKTNSSWINQTLADIKTHFCSIDSAKVLDLYFLNRLELACLGHHGLNSVFNFLNAFLVKATGVRGEAICVVKKESK